MTANLCRTTDADAFDRNPKRKRGHNSRPRSRFALRSVLAAFSIVALLVAGCGRSGPATYRVSGTVSYNGAAVSDGSIVLMPADGHLSAEAGKISGGRFTMLAKAGKNKVEIRAVREVGEVIKVMGVRARQSYIPAKYNAQTTLTAEVVPGGENKFTFELQGPP